MDLTVVEQAHPVAQAVPVNRSGAGCGQCAMAEGFGVNCEIGTGGNPLTNAANLHVMQ